MLEVHHIAGEDCYLVKVRVADTEALGTLLRERFGAIGTVRSTRTTVVLSTLKETNLLPLRDEDEAVEPTDDEGIAGRHRTRREATDESGRRDENVSARLR